MEEARPRLHDFLDCLHSASAEPDVVRRTRQCLRAFRRFLRGHGVQLTGMAGIGIETSGGQKIQWLGKGAQPDHTAMIEAALSRPDRLMPFTDMALQANRTCGLSPDAFIGRTLHRIGEGFNWITGVIFVRIGNCARAAKGLMSELTIAARAFLDRMLCRVFAYMDNFSYDLTAREGEVLGALATGMQRAQIAHAFGVAVPTVDLHLGNLRRKLRAATPAEVIARAHRYGLLS